MWTEYEVARARQQELEERARERRLVAEAKKSQRRAGGRLGAGQHAASSRDYGAA